MLDTAPLQTWHLLVLLAVFSVTYYFLGRKVKKEGHKSPGNAITKKLPYAGFILLIVITISTLPLIETTAMRFGFVLAALFIALVARTDEIKPLAPGRQLLWQIIIILVLVTSGWTIPYVSNPWGEGVIQLDWMQAGTWLLPGSIAATVWLLFFMNAINWLDGVDGLAGSVLTVAFLALAAISLLPSIQDAQTLVLSLIGLAATLAFLLWNFPPAKIYLGTVGSWFLGLYVAMVAMNGGGKLVTTLLILALPVLDAVFVLLRRLILRQPLWTGDNVSHLHHRLLGWGMTPKNISLTAAIITGLLAVASIMVPTVGKIGLLLVLAAMFLIALFRVLSKQDLVKGSQT